MLDITGAVQRTVVTTVVDGRARMGGDPPANPICAISLDSDVFLQLATGRGNPAQLAAQTYNLRFANPLPKWEAILTIETVHTPRVSVSERVRMEKAPFDHPSLAVVNGYDADGEERIVTVDAVGTDAGEDDGSACFGKSTRKMHAEAR